ncbi:MAG: hypothetical protein AAGH68_10940, partial [Pseudomonadota bacterium]
LAATLGTGWTTPAMAAKTLEAKRFIPPAIGTKWTYRHLDGRTEKLERIENGSWGGTRIVRYRREIEDEPIKIRGFSGLYGTWVVDFDEAEQGIFAADPDDRRYRWPLAPRLYWKTKYELRDPTTDERRMAKADWRVEAFERIPVPGGRTIAVRLLGAGKKPQKVWFSEHLGIRTRVQTFKKDEMIKEKVLTSYTRT